jgi:hypothetical protein
MKDNDDDDVNVNNVVAGEDCTEDSNCSVVTFESDEGQSSTKTSKCRGRLRATMSLANFEDKDKGEDLEVKPEGITIATPEEFVSKYGGSRVINKILIANNGIAGKLPDN